ncbi:MULTISPECIES: lysine N(6)-hydroxylase/L-ornithine N(5)-oxygenase family protein [Pseudomonas]|uniref:SidA/IucD/PvdA family monooxygenase n=1 Tax=Pseudomonas piscis TaxID=2614538 RepID=A0A7X1U7F1_9PSED|nr:MULTISPECIES: SidA/IucD/PvdA family monooxygenase [Pseudomonas]AZC19676.1 L-ornithine 5-monooxygenase, PvdA of pyoverdin biosynthesis [Pseudomonas sp. CMR5c]MQA57028.1 SidA/IucD/PvdA family monooxygenase [Pseudomonas piscis]POA52299.1 ornithine monooxygenase [Pseudomonas sp. FW507-12TSA]WMN15867.1 SidA/IucD/PvdA family monooxygenase [Pseudomonas piscis]
MTQAIASAHVHDLIGIGFGPSNLALAIALEERGQEHGPLDALYLDKQADYRWHGNTLVTQSELQISFLKDLVTLRNPTSPYSFVNYLKHHGRLVDFINLGTFYPCRMEFNDYLRWVAGHFQEHSRYGEEVLGIEPVLHNQQVEALRVISRDAQGAEQVRTTRSVVVSTGGTPRVPELFKGLKGDARVFHHSQYLERMAQQPCVNGKPMNIAIIGGGQSAAEAFIDLNDSFPSVQADIIMRGSALKPADDSPFVNEVFSPAFTDLVFQQNDNERERLVSEYQNTNYSVVDIDLIERIYGIFYRQKVSGVPRHAFRTLTTVEKATATDLGIELILRHGASGEREVRHYDAVVLATGYERNLYRDLLAPLQAYLGDFEVDRNYRLITDERCKAGVYLQGFSQASHGLSDTLLSVLPIRAQEIADSLYEHGKTRGHSRSVRDMLLATAS